MTREEAIAFGKRVIDLGFKGETAEFCEMAISALSENKGDLISREAVDDAIYDYSRSCTVDYAQIMEYIDKIPSVENKGEWILDETDNSVTCKTCGCSIYPNDISNGDPHFCPNCGARMKGGE